MRIVKVGLAAALIAALATPTNLGASPSPAAPESPTLSAVAAPSAAAAARTRQGKAAPSYAKARQTATVSKTSAIATDDLVVSFEARTEKSVTAAIAARGGTVRRRSRYSPTLMARFKKGTGATVARTLKAVPGVTKVEASAGFRKMASTPSDPSYPLQWALQTIGAPSAWEHAEATSTVKVAVVDTGVDYRNPDLASRIDTQNAYDILGKNRIAQDREGHGTWVAGIVGAQADDYGVVGVAPGVTILPVRVLGTEGTGDDVTVADGIRWAVDHDADIINLSLGSSTCSEVLVDAIEYAKDNGVLVVAAAGNSMSGFMGEDQSPSISYPAALPSVLAVGATTLNDTPAGFSTRGTYVDIAAPGVSVVGDKLGGGVMGADGTSASSPMVAGAAALLLSSDPGLDPEQIEQRLTDAARDVGTAGDDFATGAGRLNLAKVFDPAAPEGGRPAGFEINDSLGETLPPSPVKGDVDADGLGFHKVYHVRLTAGQRLTANITSTGEEPPYLSLFAPDTTSVFSDVPLLTAEDAIDADIAFTALSDGDYILDIGPSYYVEPGTANPYTLTYKITTPTPSEYALPGVSLPASPVKRTVPAGKEAGYYRIRLEKGQRFGVKTTSAGPAMALFPADAWMLDMNLGFGFGDPMSPSASGSPVAISDNFLELMWEELTRLPTVDRLSYVAPKDADYILAVMPDPWGNPFVSKSLTLDWQIIDPTAGSDIPGSALRASEEETRGLELMSLDRAFGPDRVYSIDLKAGERFTASLAGSSTVDADLLVFGPGAESVRSSTPLDYSLMTGGLEGLMFTAPIDGTYYVCASAYRGVGGARLDWSTGSAIVPELTARASSTTPAYGKSVTISVQATDTISGMLAPGVPVTLFQDVDGWLEPVGLAFTKSDGKATFTVKPSTAAQYRAVARDLSQEYAASPVLVKPGVLLSTPKTSTSSPRRNATFTVSGTGKPRVPSGTRAVKIRVRRKLGSSWTSTRYIWATTKSNTYKASVKLTASGKWEIVAQFVGDSLNSASSSAAKYVTVR